MKETYLSKKITEAGAETQYNNIVINILKSKVVLANILIGTVKEFSGYTVEQAISAIEGEPKVQSAPVEPVLRSKKKECSPEAIGGDSTESTSEGTGRLCFDIRFTTFAGEQGSVKLFIDVEAQKDYYPGYDLVTRAVVYGARMISEQIDTEFTTDNYNDVKKVYSIWICLNSPNYASDSIVKYSLKPENIYGDYSNENRYDIMDIVMIYISEDTTMSENKVIGMLSTLLSIDMDATRKKERLENEYGLPMTKSMDEEVNQMCNLGEGIAERAFAKGIEQGIEQGGNDMLVSLVMDKSITLDNALSRVKDDDKGRFMEQLYAAGYPK